MQLMLLMKPRYDVKCCISRESTIYTGLLVSCHVSWLLTAGCVAARGGIFQPWNIPNFAKQRGLLVLCRAFQDPKNPFLG